MKKLSELTLTELLALNSNSEILVPYDAVRAKRELESRLKQIDFKNTEPLPSTDNTQIIERQVTYTENEVLEILRQCLFFGQPEYWEQGGINKVIPYPPNGTYKKAKDYFEKYYLKNKNK